MKIEFDDGSFIIIDKAAGNDNMIVMSMCGITNNGKKATMSSSMISIDDAESIVSFLQELIKNLKK